MGIKKPSIGELRKVGHFESNIYRQPYTAGYVDGYSNIVASVYCKLWQTSTRRIDDYGKVQIVSSWNMACRFQDAIDTGVIEGTKFVQGDRRFTIIGINIIDERDFYYHFVLNLISL